MERDLNFSTITLDKHETVVDIDFLDNLLTDRDNLIKFANWCTSDSFDSRNLGILSDNVLKNLRSK